MRTPPLLLLAPLLALTLAGPRDLRADDPARPGADALAARLAELRSKRAALEKEEAAVIAELRAELKRLAELADKLGLNGPQPKPVEPPPPPKPADPLRAALRAAYDADPAAAASKREAAVLLSALYREVGVLALKKGPDGAYEVPTGGVLVRRMREAGEQLVGVSALLDARKLVAAELGKLLPTDMPLADAERADVARLLAALSATFEELTK